MQSYIRKMSIAEPYERDFALLVLMEHSDELEKIRQDEVFSTRVKPSVVNDLREAVCTIHENLAASDYKERQLEIGLCPNCATPLNSTLVFSISAVSERYCPRCISPFETPFWNAMNAFWCNID